MSEYSNNLRLEDIQQATVVDTEGNKVGSVGQVYLDDATNEPSFVTVNTGFFGTRESFVPLQGATLEGGDLRVPYTKDFIKDAPNVDDDGHMDENEQDELFRYYSAGDGARQGFAGDRTDDAVAGGGVAGGGVAGGAVGGGLGDRDTDLNRGVDADRGVANDGALGDESVVRREERLNVGKERVEAGRLRIRKHVVTEHETVTVPVEREEVEIVREPIADGHTGGSLGDDEVEVTLTEERPVVDKEVVDAERIGVDRHTVTDNQSVSADVSREEVEIDRDGLDADGRGDRI